MFDWSLTDKEWGKFIERERQSFCKLLQDISPQDGRSPVSFKQNEVKEMNA